VSLHEAFVTVLAARRAEYNAQFLAARRAAPELTEDAFKDFLRLSVDPLVCAVAAHDRSALAEVVDAAYGAGLELLSQRLAGPRAHHSVIDAAFRDLFPSLSRFVAQAPGLVLPRLCNALQQLAVTPGARPDAWCAALRGLAPLIDGVDSLLGVGQVCAWLCGLSQYRRGALEVCRRLPAPLALAALGARADARLDDVVARLERDPWFVPSSPELGFRAIGRIGGFRGFGGAFLVPPRLLRVGQELFVWSGDDQWLLVLDAFGCTLHRARAEELAGATFDVETPGVLVEPSRASFRDKSVPLLDTGAPRSVIGNANTVLVATEHSYAITVLALETAA
jgi:hypothetical protein